MFSNNIQASNKMLYIIKNLLTTSNHFIAATAYAGEYAIRQLLPDFQNFVNRGGVGEIFIGRALEEGLYQTTFNYCQNLHSILSSTGGGVYATQISFHSKIYLGQENGQDIAWIGSSNLSANGMIGWREANIKISGNHPIMQYILSEINSISNSRVGLSQIQVLGPSISHSRVGYSRVFSENPGGPSMRCLTLPLYSKKTRQVQPSHGLNWWNGRGRPRNPDEACIPLSVDVIKSNIDFFPNRAHQGTRFTAYTDDGIQMEMQIEGSGPFDTTGARFGKQIASTPRKSDFGNWILRRRIGIPVGTIVTRQILLNTIGRDTIDIIKLNNSEYIISL